MEKVKIRKCESIMDGKARAIEFADGRKATAWCDKVDCGLLKQAYDTMSEIEVELKPYKSQAGKEGLNVVKIFPDLQTIYDAKQGNASANGQYQKSVEEENESWDERKERIMTKPTGTVEMPKPEDDRVCQSCGGLGCHRCDATKTKPAPEDFGEADITSINAKSSVKLKKNSKGMGWEIKVVTGEILLLEDLMKAAIKTHRDMCNEFPVETVHVA